MGGSETAFVSNGEGDSPRFEKDKEAGVVV